MLILQTGNQATAWLEPKFTKSVEALLSDVGGQHRDSKLLNGCMEEVPKDGICWKKRPWGTVVQFILSETGRGGKKGRRDGRTEGWRNGDVCGHLSAYSCVSGLLFNILAFNKLFFLHIQGVKYLRIFAVRNWMWPSYYVSCLLCSSPNLSKQQK